MNGMTPQMQLNYFPISLPAFCEWSHVPRSGFPHRPLRIPSILCSIFHWFSTTTIRRSVPIVQRINPKLLTCHSLSLCLFFFSPFLNIPLNVCWFSIESISQNKREPKTHAMPGPHASLIVHVSPFHTHTHARTHTDTHNYVYAVPRTRHAPKKNPPAPVPPTNQPTNDGHRKSTNSLGGSDLSNSLRVRVCVFVCVCAPFSCVPCGVCVCACVPKALYCQVIKTMQSLNNYSCIQTTITPRCTHTKNYRIYTTEPPHQTTHPPTHPPTRTHSHIDVSDLGVRECVCLSVWSLPPPVVLFSSTDRDSWYSDSRRLVHILLLPEFTSVGPPYRKSKVIF